MGVLRLLLAMLVVVTHASVAFGFKTPLLSGLVAVEGFFVISGFYMAMVLNGKYVGKGKEFYANRTVRIFPSYWIVILLSVAAGLIFPSMNKFNAILSSPFAPILKFSLFFSNIFLLGSDWFCFFTVNDAGYPTFTASFLTEKVSLNNYMYMPQSWSLPVELGFYALAPLFVRSPGRVVAVIVLSFAIKGITLHHFGFVDPWKYRFYPGELGLFALGALLWHLRDHFEAAFKPHKTGLPILIGLVALVMVYREFEFLGFLAALAYTTLIAFSIPILFCRFKTDRIDRLIGELSYPVYISHMVVIGVVGQLALPWPFFTSVMATLLLSVVLAIVGDKIEVSFRRRTQSARTRLFAPT